MRFIINLVQAELHTSNLLFPISFPFQDGGGRLLRNGDRSSLRASTVSALRLVLSKLKPIMEIESENVTVVINIANATDNLEIWALSIGL